MKKHTLIENIKLDPHTYLITIGTDMGPFTGAVECRPEDYQYESEYFGFELAEMKAEIEYARAKRNYFKAQAKALNAFWGNMSKTRTYNDEDFWVKKIDSAIADIENQQLFWSDRVKYLKELYHQRIISFDNYVKLKKSYMERKKND